MRKIELSEHFTKTKMFLYSLPSIFEAFATTSFQMVDGYFVSNLLGIKPFAAVGLISPVFFVLYALGFMFGEGASALIARVMGEGDRKRGSRILSMTTVAMLITGAVVGILAAVLMPEISRLVGAKDDTVGYCIEYGRMLVLFLPAYLVNSAFMSLFITAEKGWLGMLISAINGSFNAVLDWLFMGPMKMGVEGAALATSLAALIAAVISVIYFLMPNSSTLRFTRFTMRDVRDLFQICTNGVSSMVDSIAGNLTHLLMNIQMIRFLGEIGVAAMGVYDYVCEFFLAVLFGIATTSVTVVGYKYGEKKREELDNIVKNNTVLTLILGAGLCVVFILCAKLVSKLYVGYDADTYALSVHGIRIMSFSCAAMGYNLFVSSFFSGIGNGLVSAIISLLGSLLFPLLTLLILPAVFGADAVWYATPVAVFLTAVVSALFIHFAYFKNKNVWNS
ncbi:MAG: MATE family efflux transporter [Clostridia bacterium]|nr:MATE family efflux transporter [Clostridia bacterium]